MQIIDVNHEMLQEVEIKGHIALFTELRVDRNSIPDGVYLYELRHGEDDGFPAALEPQVRVNYFGAILTPKEMKLGDREILTLEYEDFGFTGEEMLLHEFLGKQQEKEPEIDCENIADGKELRELLGESFPMTENEGDVLLSYLMGHDFLLGQLEGVLHRGDLCYEQGKIHWEPYSIDDVVRDVFEWNDEIMQEAKAEMFAAYDSSDYGQKKEYYEQLCEDEILLDAMFDRTGYGKELDELANRLAEELIRNMASPEGLDGAIKKMQEQITTDTKERKPDITEQRRGR